MRRFLSIGVVWIAIATGLVAGPAPASVPQTGSLAATVPLTLALNNRPSEGDWRGRFCTTPSCSGGSSQPGSDALGFGLAVLATGWIARRRRALAS